MTQNFRFILSYDGTRYHGWERQKKTEQTIQGKLEALLSLMTESKVEVIGAGRTDAGVHAKAMVANAFLDTAMSEQEIKDYMNHYLPEDIAVCQVQKAGPRFHSRYHALGKTYQYTCYIGNEKPVFERKYVYIPDRQPDITRMREAAEFLCGTHDFASFCSHANKKKSTVRTIDSLVIDETNGYLTFTIHGDGFLHHMVRIITGTLLEVGFGDRTADSVKELLSVRERAKAGPTAPAQGLCLLNIDYC